MAILTLKERTQQSKLAQDSFKQMKLWAVKCGTSEDTAWDLVLSLKGGDFIGLDQLIIDDLVQRDPWEKGRMSNYKDQLKRFDARQFGRIVITEKPELCNGKKVYSVIEGQGRCLVLMAMGFTKVPFEEVVVENLEKEADLFVNQDQAKSKVKGWQKWKSNLQRPNCRQYTQCQDILRLLNSIQGAEWEPMKIEGSEVDVSQCYASFKDAIIRENKDNSLPSGKRKVMTTTSVLNLLIELFKEQSKTLVLRSDIIYPCVEFALSAYKRHPLKKLRKQLVDWQDKQIERGLGISLEDLAIAINLPRQKNMADKRGCFTEIKSL